jgi:CMP-N,N'-diacetyllegionaminic acid synthase
MKILGIILARKGSKRIKNKNLVYVKNKKLIEHSFRLSKKFDQFADVMISSNDEKIIQLAKIYNILAPWKRPSKLSTDESPSYKAVIHAYNWYKKKYSKTDGIFVLQPTSPFRSLDTIKKMVSLFKYHKKRSVICVSKCLEHPEWMVSIKNNRLKPYLSKRYFTYPSQKLKHLYKINGLGYLVNPDALIKEKTLVPKNSVCYVNNSRIESIDIDNKEDLDLARKINFKL